MTLLGFIAQIILLSVDIERFSCLSFIFLCVYPRRFHEPPLTLEVIISQGVLKLLLKPTANSKPAFSFDQMCLLFAKKN